MNNLPEGWTINDDRLVQKFKFKTFSDAISFMVRCSFESEKLDHHPEWKNIYNTVWVELTTHDSGGVTQKDYELASVFQETFKKFGST